MGGFGTEVLFGEYVFVKNSKGIQVGPITPILGGREGNPTVNQSFRSYFVLGKQLQT